MKERVEVNDMCFTDSSHPTDFVDGKTKRSFEDVVHARINRLLKIMLLNEEVTNTLL